MSKRSLILEEIANLTKCQLLGQADLCISNVADLESATPEDASFLANLRYREAMSHSQAGVIFVDETTPLLEGKNFLISPSPSLAFQKLVDYLHPARQFPSGFTGIHPTAVIHPSAQIGEGVTICPYAVIDEGVIIGSQTFIGANVFVGPETKIGQGCCLHAGVIIREQCVIGDRVVIQPGAVIGSCGFGYNTDQLGVHTKLSQVGNVCIEDDVEVGANTTIDRARFKSTTIRKGSKIDNLVQIGHNAEIGGHNLIVAQTGIAGSTKLGRHVILAGQVAVAGHLTLDDGVIVTGKSGVTKSLSKGKYGGIPAMPLEEYNRYRVRLLKYADQIKQLEQKMQKLEEQLNQNRFSPTPKS